MNTKTTTASDAKTYPVVVYGASGYTGQLTCENLAKLGVPFLISGRSQAKLEAVAERMRSGRSAASDSTPATHPHASV